MCIRDSKEVADVLADFGVVSAQQGAVAGERVDQLEDVDRVLKFCLAHDRTADSTARRCGGFTGGHQRSRTAHLTIVPQSALRRSKSFSYTGARSTTDDIMAIESRFERDGGKEVLGKGVGERAQLLQL